MHKFSPHSAITISNERSIEQQVDLIPIALQKLMMPLIKENEGLWYGFPFPSSVNVLVGLYESLEAVDWTILSFSDWTRVIGPNTGKTVAE